tara:strand:- start:59 stop:649 length:591 start_codon:yes stop_codon:yes gene_type:complete
MGGLKEVKIPYLQKLTESYFDQLTDKPVVIDHRRGWQGIANIEMYSEVFGELPKIICLVRNVEEIIASYKEIFRKNKKGWEYNRDMSGNVFELNYNQLKETYNSKYRDCLLFVEYNNLVDDTEFELERIYDFIGEDIYRHNTNSVKELRAYKSVDSAYGLAGLHKIKRGVVRSKTNAQKILTTDEFSKFKEFTFWN